MTNKSFPGFSAEHYASASEYGTITHVTIHRDTRLVAAIGLNSERLGDSLGQAQVAPAGVIPVIGEALAGIGLRRNALTGAALSR